MIASAVALLEMPRDPRRGGRCDCGDELVGVALKFSTGDEEFNGWRG
jgi:hypothetical protein